MTSLYDQRTGVGSARIAQVFSGIATPSNPRDGDIWFETTAKTVSYYSGGVWIEALRVRGGTVTTIAYTAAELAAATNGVNTTGKAAGLQVFDSTNGKPLWASGAAATDPWNDATGATAITPA